MENKDNKIKILILEDSPLDAELMQRALQRDGVIFDATVVDHRDAFINSLEEFKPEVILSDHNLGGFYSEEALQLTKKITEETPFILVTGTVSEEFAASIIKAGATDYILKDNLIRLSFSIQSALSQKEAKEKLKRSEEQFQYTIDGMVDGVQIISFDWRYLYVNDIIGKQGKYLKEELIGFSMFEKYPGIEETEMFKQLKRCMDDRILIEMEDEFTFPNGTKGWLNLSMQPIPQGVLILSRDITDKKLSIQQLQAQNEKIRKINAELDRFLYSVSHELRSPICTGLGLVNVARIAKTETERNDILDKLELSIKNHDNILQNMHIFFEFNRLDLVYEKIDFENVLENCFTQLRSMEGYDDVQLNISIEGNNQFFSVKNFLHILFKNLISNSIKFRNRVNKSFIKVLINLTSEQAFITIKDNGCGIKEAHLENIFKVFYRTTNQPGSGFGLYMVDKIIEKLQGKISIESKQRIGTTFFISIPNAKDNSL